MWIFAFVLFTEFFFLRRYILFFFLRRYIQSLKGTNIQASFILWEKQIEKNYQISNQKYADVLLQKFFYLINYSILFIKRYIWLVHVLLLNIQTPQYYWWSTEMNGLHAKKCKHQIIQRHYLIHFILEDYVL